MRNKHKKNDVPVRIESMKFFLDAYLLLFLAPRKADTIRMDITIWFVHFSGKYSFMTITAVDAHMTKQLIRDTPAPLIITLQLTPVFSFDDLRIAFPPLSLHPIL